MVSNALFWRIQLLRSKGEMVLW